MVSYCFLLKIAKAIPSDDPSAELTRTIVASNLKLCQAATSGQLASASYFPPLYVSLGIMVFLILYSYGNQIFNYLQH